MSDEILRRVYRGTATGDSPDPRAERRMRSPYLTRLIAHHFPAARDAAIVDIGCGAGLLLDLARERGYTNLRGFDVAAAELAAGRADIVAADAQGALDELPAASVDLLVSFDLLEHLDRTQLPAITDAALRALRPGGAWLIHTPNGVSPFFGRIRYGDLTHRLAFTPRSLGQWLLASGFSSVNYFEEAPVPHGLKSGVRRVLWGGLRRLYRALIAIETGDTGAQVIVSQNFLARAIK